MIDYCRTSFNQFFNADKFKGVGDEDKFKLQHRLFCNVKFVGELYRRNLITENVILSVFDLLLAVDNNA